MEALACAQMPPAARGISAVLCPPGASGELEFVAMGGEDTGVYIWDVSRPGRPPLVVNKLQVWTRTGCMRQATCVLIAYHLQLTCRCMKHLTYQFPASDSASKTPCIRSPDAHGQQDS